MEFIFFTRSLLHLIKKNTISRKFSLVLKSHIAILGSTFTAANARNNGKAYGTVRQNFYITTFSVTL